jgi:DNA polymerase-3 subunit beta
MKVLCGKEELLKGISVILPVVSAKSTLPVLANFLFETEGNKIKLSSTDLEIAVKCYIKGEIIEEGSITIPAKSFADIIKEVSGDVEIRSDETQINIKSGKSKFTLMGIASSDYPVIPQFPKENNFDIKKDVLSSMLKKTVFAVSKDSQRYVLNGVYFIAEEGKIKMVSTDGRRLAFIEEDLSSKIKGKAIVPTKAVNDMLRLLSADGTDETVKLGLSDNQIALEVDGINFISTLIEGTFPNYEQVIPKKSDNKIKLNVKETLQAVRQMALLTQSKMSSDRSAAVKFTFDANIMRVSASTTGLGSGEAELSIEYSGKSAEINFNPGFIKEVLQNMDSDSVNFEFSNALNPAVISPEKDKNYICVVMPMRV